MEILLINHVLIPKVIAVQYGMWKIKFMKFLVPSSFTYWQFWCRLTTYQVPSPGSKYLENEFSSFSVSERVLVAWTVLPWVCMCCDGFCFLIGLQQWYRAQEQALSEELARESAWWGARGILWRGGWRLAPWTPVVSPSIAPLPRGLGRRFAVLQRGRVVPR